MILGGGLVILLMTAFKRRRFGLAFNVSPGFVRIFSRSSRGPPQSGHTNFDGI